MGGFWTSQIPATATALVTSGAASCLIIVVHCTNGHGALGHYAAHQDPVMILGGLRQMLETLPNAAVDTILFAAGIIGNNTEQKMYQMRSSGTREMALGARVMWPKQAPDDPWGFVMYLPASGEVALFCSFSLLFIGPPLAGADRAMD
jgi:hypothetical protein